MSRLNRVLLFLFGSPAVILLLGVAVENISYFSGPKRRALSSAENMSEIQQIAKNQVKNAVTGEMVAMESFWQDQPAVITFFRRWGCGFCRLAAKELSSIKSDLDAHNVRLIGIGVEDLGKEDFINGNFFTGELYIDEEKKCYKDLDYKRYGKYTVYAGLLTKTSLEAIWAVRSQKVGGDTKGDLYQVGGTLVVSAGGEKVLLNHKQQGLADHVNLNEVLKSLGITPKEGKISEAADSAKCDVAGPNGQTACE